MKYYPFGFLKHELSYFTNLELKKILTYFTIDFLRLHRRQGIEENQFAPLGDGVNKLIFKRS
jgi:hypothetical protein